jgi:hypothetical protein
MCRANRDYTTEKTSVFGLDDALFSCCSKDNMVEFVRKEMWLHYDDVKDHKIVATKLEWDFFNRFLLLLESDAEVEFVKTRRAWGVGWHRLLGKERASSREIAVTPFPSIGSILSFRRQATGFIRSPYPKKMAARRIRGLFKTTTMRIVSGPFGLVFAAIFFMVSLLPLKESIPRIRIAGHL